MQELAPLHERVGLRGDPIRRGCVQCESVCVEALEFERKAFAKQIEVHHWKSRSSDGFHKRRIRNRAYGNQIAEVIQERRCEELHDDDQRKAEVYQQEHLLFWRQRQDSQIQTCDDDEVCRWG